MRALLTTIILAGICGPAMAQIESVRDEANAAVTAGDFGTAITKLREIVERAPDDGSAHYQLGTLLMDNAGELAAAATHFEQAAELGFQPLGAAYRLSRIYASKGNASGALEQLEILANGGFGQINLIDGQADYDGIRDDARFIAATDTIRSTRFPCSNDERHHAFDFWIGEWTVTSNGQFAGDSNITSMLGDCTIFEQWTSASGGEGKSFNYYDPAHDHWRQIWISDSGSFIEFTGEARDGGIFYTAETINPADSSVTLHKFEFTQYENGDVRQYWETSNDDGATWNAIWDGRYEPK